MNKKILTITSTIFILFILVPIFGKTFDVFGYDYSDAEDYYPMACDIYEVSNISNGSFEKVSCHKSFEEAKDKMKSNNNYVVRYVNSKSPTRIVAMNSGVVSIYPGRTGDDLAYIYQNIDERNSYWKSTYCSEHAEAYYLDTPTMNSSYYPYGAVKINLRGFEGYISILNVDLIPTQFIKNSWKMWLGGENQSYSEYPYDAIPGQDYYEIAKDGNYTSLKYTYYYTYSKKHGLFTEHSMFIDNAENYLNAGMKSGVKYYSADGINFYSDTKLTKKVATVYNYYRFLPLRTKTDIKAESFDKYLKKIVGSADSTMLNEGATFINCQNSYGANALLVYAMGCLESGYGKSYYANDRYNLFGWHAYDSDPGQASAYTSIKECVKAQMGENLRYYMDYDHSYYYGTCLGNKGTGFNVLYSSDADWAAKICNIAYAIDKYDNGNDGTLTDYNKYTVGVVNEFDPNIYSTLSGKDVLYTARFGRNYQKDFTVVVLENLGTRYKIQSTNNVVDGTRLHQSGCYKYDWDKSVGYIDTKYVDILNGKEVPYDEKQYETFSSVRDITLKDSVLTISGIGGLKGLDFEKDSKNVKHEVIFYDCQDSSKSFSFEAQNVNVDNYSLNDGHDYTSVGFSLTLSLPSKKLLEGTYYINIKTTNGDYSNEATLRNSNDKYSSISYQKNLNAYRITSNYIYNYRIEFDVFKTQLDYSLINKPTGRKSLISFDDISFDENGILTVAGHSFIYYLNYDNLDNITYNVYLVSSDGTTVKLDTEHVDNKLDYKKQLNSSYNLDNISFTSSIDMKDIKGTYNLILEIKNEDYVDYVEFMNRSHMQLASFKNDDMNIQVLTSNVRDRIYLVAED